MTAAQRQHGLAQVGQARWLARLLFVGNPSTLPLIADIGAGPGARGQETFGNQLIERIENGDPRQRQLFAQGPRRRQAHAPLHFSAENLFANLQIELAVQGDGAGTVQLDSRQQQTCGGFHDMLVWGKWDLTWKPSGDGEVRVSSDTR